MDRDWMRRLGGRMREARETAGMTIEETARRLDMAAAHLERAENGERLFSPEGIAALCRALHVAPDRLLDGIWADGER